MDVAVTGQGPTPEGDLATRADLARRYDVTTQTIANWVKKGILSPKTTEQRGRITVELFEPAACDQAVKRRRKSWQGGKRRGAGRKRASRPLDVAFRTAESDRERAAQVAIDIETAGDPGANPAEAESAMERLGVCDDTAFARLKPEHIDLLCRYGERVGVTPQSIAMYKDALSAQMTAVKIARLEGTLVNADEYETALAGMLEVFRRRLETMADRLAPRIAGECELDKETVPDIKALIDEQVRECLETLSAAPVGES